MTFKPGKTKLCYKQSVIDDKNITSFIITIVPTKHVRIGAHGSTQIIMSKYHVCLSHKLLYYIYRELIVKLLDDFHVCVGCEVPSKPIRGNHYFQSTAIGMVITYSCDEGLKLIGDQSRECLKTGVWSGSVPVCQCMHTLLRVIYFTIALTVEIITEQK